MLSEKPSKETSYAIESLTGYKSFTSNNKHGVMKGDKTILSCEYDDIEFLSPTIFKFIKSKTRKELVLAKKDGNYELINLKNKNLYLALKLLVLIHIAKVLLLKLNFQIQKKLVYIIY